jgi:hypothetical protein
VYANHLLRLAGLSDRWLFRNDLMGIG